MKHKLTKLFLLFVTVSILTSSKEESRVSKRTQCLNDEHTCLEGRKDYAINFPVIKSTVVQEKNLETEIAPVADNEISLSPISRFILLQ